MEFDLIKKNLMLFNQSIIEVRILHTAKGTISGYFDIDHYNELAHAIKAYDGKYNIFFTLNQIDENVMARSLNHLTQWSKHTTTDSEITKRKWILIDLDPVRPAGVSSTDDELENAEKLVDKIVEFFDGQGFPEVVRAMSGNGYHLLLSVDLSIKPEDTNLVKNFLAALDAKFSTKKVKVDMTTYNLARITKLYGTMACKGDDTKDRPHRRSYIISVPEDTVPVTRKQLEDIVLQYTDVTDKKKISTPLAKVGSQNSKKQKFSVINARDFCEAHGIEISHEKPSNNGGTCYVLDFCPWNPEHTDKSAYIIEFPNGKIVAGCHHDSCSGENWKTLLKKFPDTKINAEPCRSEPLENTDKMSASEIILSEFKQSGNQLYRDKGENAYVSVLLGNGQKEYMPVQDKRFRRFLNKSYFENYGKALNRESIQQVMDTLEAVAVYNGEEIEPAVRCKYDDGNIYYHLADDEQTVICIDETGVRVLEKSPIPFIRKSNILEQMMPKDIEVAKGKKKQSFRKIARKYWKFKSEEDLLLHNVVLLTRFISDIPAPILYYRGDRGSAKTTSMKLDGLLVDPSHTDVKALPNAINDVVSALSGQYMVSFDNLEGGISPELSNLLCICCSSGFYSKRKLFTDNDTADIKLNTRLSFSGITTITERADFLDRCVSLSSRRISASERRTVDEILTDFYADLPYLLYRAMKILARAIPIYKQLDLPELPRMADFAKWGYAIAEVLKYGGDHFLDVYKKNQEDLLEVMVEEDVLLSVLINFIEENEYFVGNMTELYSQLTKQAQKLDINTQFGWIKTVNALSRKLFQTQSVLDQFDIHITRGKSNGKRYVEIWKEGQKTGGIGNE